MLESDPGIAPLFESPVAIQLRRGFPWLRFEPTLESEFRQSHREEIRGQLRIYMWLALALVVAFFVMGHMMLSRVPDIGMNALRFGVFLPIVIAGLIITYSRAYQRVFAVLAQLLAPAFGIGVIAADLMASRVGVSFFSAVVLSVIYIYFLVGLFFYAALRSALIVLVAYVIGATAFELSTTQTIYNSLVLLFANVIGATVCYTLERANRTNYLEARLLTEMASRDGLTGIYNRRVLDDRIDTVWQQGGREHMPLALLLIDIDHFKAYNDYFGHQAGDECLTRVAHVLARCARRPLDFTARYGGEEFAIVLFNARRDYVEEVARRIQTAMEAAALKHPASPVSKQLTVSIGAACVMPSADRSHFGFVQLADEALYEAKAQGRNRMVIMDKEYESLSTGSFRNRAAAAQSS
jgi:diguanylate cyclase (GGDEF)-like protein